MPAEPVSPEDATLLCATDPSAPLQIGAVCFFRAGPLRGPDGRIRIDDLRSHVEGRLHLAPRFRQRIVPVPFDAARPMWIDDDRFDITHHVQRAELATGGDAALRAFVADLLGRGLDPDRPLWDLWVVDGIDGDDDRVAVVLRVHHAMVDGITLLNAAFLLLDAEPDPTPDEPPPPWAPEPTPAPLQLLMDGLRTRRRHQVDIAAEALRTVLDPRRLLGMARSAVGSLTSPPTTAPSLALNGRVGRRRDMVWTSLPLAGLLAVRRAQGTTLNDVVLAVTADAIRRHLGAATALDLKHTPPRVLVPVGDVAGTATGDGNAFSFMVADLPVGREAPADRLARVHDDMDRHKASSESATALSLFSVVDVVPLPLLRRLAPRVLAHQPFVNLAVTNIPGTRDPMYLLGSRMESLYPIVTGVGNIALIVGVLSYRSHLGVGITVDPDVIDDVDGLLDHIREAADDLVRTVTPGP